MNNSLALDCQACRSARSMLATKIAKFSAIVRVIGVILVIPSLLGLGFSALMFVSFIISSSTIPSARTDAEQVGQAIGSGVVIIVIVAVAAGSLVSGLLGWLLLSTRKVFKCGRCGFVLDRD